MNKERIDILAEKIVTMGLSVPSIFLLEAHIPMTTIAHTLSIAVSPFAVPFLGSEKMNVISELFSDRANIEQLIQAIEDKEKK